MTCWAKILLSAASDSTLFKTTMKSIIHDVGITMLLRVARDGRAHRPQTANHSSKHDDNRNIIINKTKKKHRLVQWKRKQRPEYGQLTLKNFKKCYFFVETSCHQCTTGRQRWGKWTHRTTNVQYSQPTFDNCGGIHAINSLHNQVTGKQFLSIMQGVVQSFIKWCNHANQNWTA